MFNPNLDKIDPDPYPAALSVTFASTQKPAVQPAPKYQVSLLSKADIPAFLELQQKVWDSLSDDKKHHLKLRSAEDLQIHINARMPIIGVKDQFGNLKAQGLVAYPFYSDAVKNLDGYPIVGAESTTAIVQSLAVDPDAGGQGLSQLILDTAKDVATMSGHTQILAKVADDNKGSQCSFLKSAFSKATQGTDPNQGYPVTYFHFPIYKRALQLG